MINTDQKKRHVVSYENMKPELAAAFEAKYPKGFNDYFPDIVQYPKPDGTTFHAVTIETEDSIYLVKLKVQTDDLEELAKWLEGEEEAETEQVAGTTETSGEGDALPDGDITQYGGGDDSDE